VKERLVREEKEGPFLGSTYSIENMSSSNNNKQQHAGDIGLKK
jgi:hypothetical protein